MKTSLIMTAIASYVAGTNKKSIKDADYVRKQEFEKMKQEHRESMFEKQKQEREERARQEYAFKEKRDKDQWEFTKSQEFNKYKQQRETYQENLKNKRMDSYWDYLKKRDLQEHATKQWKEKYDYAHKEKIEIEKERIN